MSDNYLETRKSRCYPIPINPQLLTHYGKHLFYKGLEDSLFALAKAVSSSINVDEKRHLTFSVRIKPTPVLTLFGCFDKADVAWARAQGHALIYACKHISYKSYRQIEIDCEKLAEILVRKFGYYELKKFQFTALPRGGLIVLGFLGYMLNLSSNQLFPPYSNNVPLVVVDDCALTGYRFGKFLQSCENQRVIFAHLYSHPSLRRNIKSLETKVLECISADDLDDYASEQLGNDLNIWQENWSNRLEGPRYWQGKPDHICFPWNEPDRSIWNSVTQQVEAAWRIVPQDRCIKNRLPPGKQPIPIQIQPKGVGPLRPTDEIVFGEFEDQVLICHLDTGDNFGFSEVGAEIWRAILKYGNLDDVLNHLLNDYAIDEAILKEDIRLFVESLINRGILEVSPV